MRGILKFLRGLLRKFFNGNWLRCHLALSSLSSFSCLGHDLDDWNFSSYFELSGNLEGRSCTIRMVEQNNRRNIGLWWQCSHHKLTTCFCVYIMQARKNFILLNPILFPIMWLNPILTCEKWKKWVRWVAATWPLSIISATWKFLLIVVVVWFCLRKKNPGYL